MATAKKPTKKRAPAAKKTAAKKTTAKKRAPKKAAKKAAPKAKRPRGRPRTPQGKLDQGVELYAKGASLDEAAKEAGVGARTLDRELRRLGLETRPAAGAEVALPELDPQATSLDLARQGLAHAIMTQRSLPPGHRSYVTQQQVVQRWLDKVRKWEREESARETPEQQQLRLQREAGEVVDRIEQHVAAYEDEARKQGTCLWCGQELSAELAAELHGGAAP